LLSCKGKQQKIIHQPYSGSKIIYARKFNIIKKNETTEIVVYNSSHDNNYRYILSEKNNFDRPGLVHIKVPVKKVVCLSTTHIAFIDFLGKTNTIVAISGKNLIYNNYLKSVIDSGKVKDIGYDQNLDYETIIKLKPDLIFAYSIENESAGFFNKFKDLGIPVVMVAEFLEENPLGKTEWIKFFASFYGLENIADEKFKIIEKEYHYWKNKAVSISNKPRVMTGLLWNNTWYVPGKNSYLAQLINDAGGIYIWGEDAKQFSYPISLEKVLSDGQTADIWINTGSINTKIEIKGINTLLIKLQPYKNDKIYNNNNRCNGMANDYWETGVVNPDKIIADLFCIFHSELCKNHELVYYKKLE